MEKVILLSLLFSTTAFSQVGINLENPLVPFHVNGDIEKPNLTGDDFSITSTGSIGIGTIVPDPSSAIEIQSSNKGFLPPRVILTSNTDKSTIPNPATGLTVYHLGETLEAGLYYNVGTAASPNWTKGGQTIINENLGSMTYKTPIQPLSIRPVVKAGDFEFSVVSSGGRNYPFMKYTGGGSREYSSFVIESWSGSGKFASTSTGTANETSSRIAGSTDIGSNNEINILRIYDTVSKKVYRYETNLIVISGVTNVSQLVEVY